MGDLNTSSIVTAFSHLTETAYGTERASSATFKRLDETEPVLFEINPEWIPNMTNAGSDEQSGKSIVSVNLFEERTIPIHFNYQMIGYFLQMIFGKLSKTGSSAPYTHTFSCYDKNTDGRQLPTRTFLQRQGAVIKLFRSIGLKELSIEKDGNGYLKASIVTHGQGYEAANPSGYSIPSKNTGLVYGYNREAAHEIDDTVSTQGLSCEIESWKWTFAATDQGDGFRDCSSLFDAADAESGLIRTERLFGLYDFKWSARVRAKSDHDLRTILRSGNLCTITTEISSPTVMTATPYSLTLTDPNSELTSVKLEPVKGEFIYANIEAKCNANDGTGLMETTAVLINNVASYTA